MATTALTPPSPSAPTAPVLEWPRDVWDGSPKGRRTSPVLAVVIGAALIGVALVGLRVVAGGPPEPPGRVLRGEFTVFDVTLAASGGGIYDAVTTVERINDLLAGASEPCPDGLGGGYSDLRGGTPVSVRDGSGALLATGHLVGGTLDAHGCHFTFEVEVPRADFYQVEVASRGTVPYSLAELDTAGWQVALSVGAP